LSSVTNAALETPVRVPVSMVRTLALLLIPTVVFAQQHYQCTHGKSGVSTPEPSWTANKELEDVNDGRWPKTPARHTVNLDLPASERWLEIGQFYADQSDLIIEYFESMLPHAAVVAIDKIAAQLIGYKGFGDFGDEMRGYADGLGLDLGYVVAANLVYQLESIGVNCSNWNNTGPTDQCDGDDTEIAWLESDHYSKSLLDQVQTGYCTSVVSEESGGGILHGRNLDWNLEENLREMIITVDFERGGELLYTGSTIVSFVGLLNAMKPGGDGFSFSMDARCQGGKILANLIEALAEGAMTPCQHSRTVMEAATDFADAVALFESGDLIDDGYFIVGGASDGEGAVVSRARNRNVDTWMIDPTDEEHGWYRLETNYDHWQPVPSADDRRTPGYENMEAVGKDNIDTDNLLSDVMTVWPTYNPHTDLTCIMSAKYAAYDCSIWMDANTTTAS
jgi:N-acylethanolamine-hydrolysing acid amidase